MNTKHFLKIPFEIKSIDDSDPKFLFFKGYASTFNNVDRVDDVVLKGAFSKCLAKRPSVKVLWNHNYNQPVGKSLLMREDDIGLYVEGRISKRTNTGNDVAVLIEDGVVNQMSIGYYAKDFDIKGDVRFLKEVDLIEFSFVTEPANEEAMLTGFKAFNAAKNLPIAERDYAWNSNEAVSNIREFTKSIDAPSPNYKDYFMYYDAENESNFGAYKLPFCDVIDDEIYIIPRAIYAIAGVLNGARGGVEIPNSDRAKIMAFVNELYRRMADKFDDTEIESPLEEEFDSLKSIESALKLKGFSQKQSKTLISKVKEFSNQRDAEERAQRDVELQSKILDNLNNLITDFKQLKK